MRAAVDPAFQALPQKSIHFHIWRVENLQLVDVPRGHYGQFYRGDSYIVVAMAPYKQHVGVDTKTSKTNANLDVHIHYWLGSQSSIDESTVAAYKSVELDDFLGGDPIQHREAEGYESKRFLSYFKYGTMLLEGGMESGLREVTDDFKPKLLQVKGKRVPMVKQVSKIRWRYMNDGDVYVLDTREVVFVWVGCHANKFEKLQGAKVALNLKEQHKNCNVVFLEDGKENNMINTEKELFNRFLPLDNKKVKPASAAPDDEAMDQRNTNKICLHQCSDASGRLNIREVKKGPLRQNDLNSDDSFIVDNGSCGIWVWIGKKASKTERREGMKTAEKFIKQKGYRVQTPITKVIDGAEPVEFTTLFSTWRRKYQSSNRVSYQPEYKERKPEPKFDARTLHNNQKLAAETRMVDDGSGKKKVWRVENFQLVPVRESDYGKFFSGDSYVIFYEYGNQNYIIYYWLGAKSSTDERGTAAHKAVELDDQYGGVPVQVRVVQGKEPRHFISIFGGNIIIYSGGKASAFDGPGGRDKGIDSRYLLHVRSTTPGDTRTIQVERKASSLNSNDAFILKTTHKVYVWIGKGASKHEQEVAKAVAITIMGSPVMVKEGQEPEDFWKRVGGREQYSSDRRLVDTDEDQQPRLFQCSNATGRMKVEEIFDFCQADLIEDDVMLLDTWDAVFVWIGNDSNRQEREASEVLAEAYLRTDPAGRDSDTPIYRIKQGHEPPNFTGFFGVWDRGLWSNSKTFEQLMAESHSGKVTEPKLIERSKDGGIKRGNTYSIETLRIEDPDQLPLGVDPTRKEQYLSDGDFRKVFGMSKEEYSNVPQWKRNNLKKAAGFF